MLSLEERLKESEKFRIYWAENANYWFERAKKAEKRVTELEQEFTQAVQERVEELILEKL